MHRVKPLLLTAFLACSIEQALAEKIGVVLSNFTDKYVTYLQEGVQDFAKQHPDAKIVISDAGGDSARLVNQVENFIEQGMQAVVVQPTDRKIVKSIGKKLDKAGIPLVIINHYPEPEDLHYVRAYIGSHERQAGTLQAEAIVKALDGKPARVGILLGPLALEAQAERTAGLKEVFAKYPNIKVVTEQEAAWDRERAMRIAEDWFQGQSLLNVIAANNDEMAIGALLAAEKAGKKDDDVIIAGIDATPDALQFLGKGLDITIYQDAHSQGYYGADAAYSLAAGQKVSAEHWIDFETVTPADKDKSLKKEKSKGSQ